MAAKEDKSKTSKTARVMNLLSKKGNPVHATGEAEGAAGRTNLPPITPPLEPDAEVSGQIKDALEDALEDALAEETNVPAAPAQEETGPAAPAQPDGSAEPPQADTSEKESKAETAAPVQAETPAPQGPAVHAEAPAPQETHAQVEAPAPQETHAQAEAPAPQETHAQAEAPAPIKQEEGYVNVMQILVEEKAEKYVKLFGLCQCERCLNDVKALALNHLPSKYVVMDPGERIPKLTFYEGRYESEITTQLVQACKVVLSRPHHTR